MFIFGYSTFLPSIKISANNSVEDPLTSETDSLKRKLNDTSKESEVRTMRRKISIDKTALISQEAASSVGNEVLSQNYDPLLNESTNKEETTCSSGLSDKQIEALLTDVSGGAKMTLASYSRWKPEETDLLRKYKDMTPEEIHEKFLPQRTVWGIIQKKGRLGLTRQPVSWNHPEQGIGKLPLGIQSIPRAPLRWVTEASSLPHPKGKQAKIAALKNVQDTPGLASKVNLWWTDKEVDILRANPDMPSKELAKTLLPNRTQGAINYKRSKIDK